MSERAIVTTLGARFCLAGDAAGKWADEFALRRARKSHRCNMPRESIDRPTLHRSWDGGEVPPECSGWIKAGDPYVEYMGEAEPFHAGSRYCAACAVAAGLARLEGA